MARWQNEKEIIIKDNETGEVVREESIKSGARVIKEPPYFKVYLDMYTTFKNVKGINNKFLYVILHYMKFADNEQKIYLNKELKIDIGKKLNWKEDSAPSRCNVELNKLCKTHILRRVGSGTYQVNPSLIGKGDWPQIQHLREVTFDLWNGEITQIFDEEALDIDKQRQNEIDKLAEELYNKWEDKMIEHYQQQHKPIDPTEEERRAGYNGTKTYDEEIAG